MESLQIASMRLSSQRIAVNTAETPADVVRWLGAVQAQDYAAAKWAVALRTRSCADAELETAFELGAILRTHVMRPTWHFVAPEDIRWMQMLTAPRVEAILAYQYRRLELDVPILKRSLAAVEKALRGGRQLTRAELGAALARAGIEAEGLRLAHIVLHAELQAVVCSGGRRGKQFTYALIAERAANARELTRDEALAVLTERYFKSHGPATARDYAWWSGLSSADVQAGLEMVQPRLLTETSRGQTYWMSGAEEGGARRHGKVHLLPNFDEYIVGYTDRAAIFDSVHAQHLDARHNPLFNNTVVSAGRVVGTWTRTMATDSLMIKAKSFEPLSASDTKALQQAAKRFAKFLGASRVELRF